VNAEMYLGACRKSGSHETRQDGYDDYTKYYPQDTEETSKERLGSSVAISENIKAAEEFVKLNFKASV
jgi:hypothetical protein